MEESTSGREIQRLRQAVAQALDAFEDYTRCGRDRLACESVCLVEDVREAFDAFDDYAAKDLDHDLHAIVERYRRALGVDGIRRYTGPDGPGTGPTLQGGRHGKE